MVGEAVKGRVCAATQNTLPTEGIARAVLSRDRGLVEYCETITDNTVGPALRSHGVVEKEGLACRLAVYGRTAPVSFRH